jgi:hypothetical protein
MAVTVNMPKDVAPEFPDRCISCGQIQPNWHFRVCTHAIGWWTIALWSYGKKFCVEVPVCEHCNHDMRRQKRVRTIFTWAFGIVGVCVAFYVLAEYTQTFWGGWLAMAIGLVFLSPVMLWEWHFPPALDLTAYSESVDYDFRDPEYALEFACLNDSVRTLSG